MNRFFIILLIFSVVQKSSAQDWVSSEQFRNTKSAEERANMIAKAPVEQRLELQRIDIHMIKLQEHGTEEAVRFIKESAVAKARGFKNLDRLIIDYVALWNHYRNDVIEVDKKLGATPVQLASDEQITWAKRLAATTQLKQMHDFICHLAPSISAFDLERKAGFVREEFARKTSQEGRPNPHVTEQDMLAAGKEMDRILEQLKQLPALPVQQYEKEYNDFPEGKIDLN